MRKVHKDHYLESYVDLIWQVSNFFCPCVELVLVEYHKISGNPIGAKAAKKRRENRGKSRREKTREKKREK